MNHMQLNLQSYCGHGVELNKQCGACNKVFDMEDRREAKMKALTDRVAYLEGLLKSNGLTFE